LGSDVSNQGWFPNCPPSLDRDISWRAERSLDAIELALNLCAAYIKGNLEEISIEFSLPGGYL